MLESLSTFLPSSVPVVDVSKLVRSSWNTFNERKLFLQSALAEVDLQLGLADHNNRLSRTPPRMRTGRERLQTSMLLKVRSQECLLTVKGRDAWKEDASSPAYDFQLLGQRLKQLREARLAGDLPRVLFLLRISLTRNFAHAGNPEVIVHKCIKSDLPALYTYEHWHQTTG
jgi:hypothetical protein